MFHQVHTSLVTSTNSEDGLRLELHCLQPMKNTISLDEGKLYIEKVVLQVLVSTVASNMLKVKTINNFRCFPKPHMLCYVMYIILAM